MRNTVLRPLFAVLATAAIAVVTSPVHAQVITSPSQKMPFTARVGGFVTNDSTIRHQISPTFLSAGVDYAFKEQPGISRSIVSVGYIDRSSGNNTLRMFPITVGQLILATNSTSKNVQPYYGAGLGGYLVHQDFNRNTSGNISHDYVAFGGYAAAGIEFNRSFILEARYHFVTAANGINPSGLELSAGLRF